MSNKNSKVPFVNVYVDSNLLFDALASIDNGFSLMEEVKTIDKGETSSDVKANLQAGFSIPSMLNLVKIGTDAKVSSNSGSNSEQSLESSRIRYHTLGSLLYKLVNSLEQQKFLKNLDNKKTFEEISCGDIIKATGVINLNPLNDSLEKTIRLIKGIELLTSFAEFAPNENKKNIKQQSQLLEKIRTRLQLLLTDITPAGQKALILKNEEIDFSILFSIYDSFTRDIAGLQFGSHTFTVIGKVVGVSQNGANLLERSSLSGFNNQTFEALKDAFSKLGENFALPAFKVELDGKVLTIIPIAIYS